MADIATPHWSLRIEPRAWQRIALGKWGERLRGVVSVVTGGGKTIFAFLCMREFKAQYPEGIVIILVPTITLLDQWYVSLQEDFGVPADDIACYSSQERSKKPRAVNVLVINTGRQLVEKLAAKGKALLIVDECHRAGSPENAKALQGDFAAALGLSATPQREYDQGFEEHVVPALGPVIFEYDYVQAHKDGVVAPFDLVNVQIDLLPHEQEEYDKLSKRAAVLLKKGRSGHQEPGAEERLKRVLQQRAAVSATAKMRLPVAAKIVEQNRGVRTIVFHERVASAKSLYDILKQRNHSVCLYHSKIAPEVRRDNLRLFRRGVFDVLISCRALDEGMNAPETTVAVIASSTASQRQRIQRLGRVLRPAKGKKKATIYTLFATDQERRRLQKEADDLEGIAGTVWSMGKRQAPD
jgi:superfamily II DNA or RNA helicase